MYSDLLERLATTDDRMLLQKEIQQLRSAMFKTGPNSLKAIAQQSLRAWVAEIVLKDIEQNGTKTTIEEYLQTLEEQVAALPILELTLAFEPTQNTLQTLHRWAIENLKQSVLLQIKYQPEILGGAIIVWQGKYRDLSIKKQVTEYIDQKLATLFQKVEPTS